MSKKFVSFMGTFFKKIRHVVYNVVYRCVNFRLFFLTACMRHAAVLHFSFLQCRIYLNLLIAHLMTVPRTW